jgi:hypothetical protein
METRFILFDAETEILIIAYMNVVLKILCYCLLQIALYRI